MIARTTGVWSVRLAAGVAVIGAAVIAADAIGPRTPVDAALSWLVLVVVVASWLAPGPEVEAVAVLGAPLLIATAVAVGDEALRLVGYGIVLGATLIFVGGALIVARGLNRLRGSFLAAVAVAASTVALAPGSRISAALAIAGTFALGVSVLHDGRRNAVPLAVVTLVGITTPLVPGRASLFPLVVAAALFASKHLELRTAAIALFVGALAGRWGLALVLVPLAVRGAERALGRGRRGLVPIPGLSGASLATLGKIVLVDPGAIREAMRTDGLTALTAAGLVAVGSLLRAPLGWRFVLAALVFIAASTVSREDNARAAVPVTFAALALALVAWSGVPVSVFPLPVAVSTLAVIAAIAAMPLMLGRSALAGAVSASIVLACVTFAPVAVPPAFPPNVVAGGLVGAGESITARPDAEATTVSIVASGVNIADRSPDRIIGWIDVLDGFGAGYRRTIRVRDVADWGAFRESMAFSTRNVVPEHFEGSVSGYGRGAYFRGSGRIDVTVANAIEGIRVTGAEALGEEGRLDVERIGFGP